MPPTLPPAPTSEFVHDLSWNGAEWWVTTYNALGAAVAGMPLTMFIVEHPDGVYH